MTPEAQLSASFSEIAQSLRRLTPPTAQPETAQTNALIIASIEDALIDMIPKVSFDRDAIRKALQTNSSRVVRAVAEHLGEEGLRDPRQPHLYHLSDVIRARGINTLKTLADMGIPISQLATRMIPHAFRHSDDAYMKFIRDDLDFSDPIHDHVDISKIIDSCPAIFVDTVAKEMMIDLRNPASTLIKNLSNCAPSNLKAMAILTFTRRDLSQFIEQERISQDRHPSIAEVYHQSRSNHGRLTLMSKEPDLASILMRGPRAKFFELPATATQLTPDW